MKYKNKPTMYKGIRYASKKEADYAINLDWKLKAKEIKSWARQICFNLVVQDQHICKYYLDFMVEYNNGTIEYIEVKSEGTKTELWKIKWKLVQVLYPDVKFVLYE
jgi:hypothetical protein